jgi:hypothetical protein
MFNRLGVSAIPAVSMLMLIAYSDEANAGAASPQKLDQQYAAKMVCGLQKDPDGMQLVRGFYGTAINIHNPGERPVVFTKKLALTFPPREQKPGKIIPIAKHELAPDEALEVDCDDVRREAFGGQFPDSFIKGFIVIESEGELDVTAVYTAAGLDPDSKVTSVTSIDVDRVLGRRPQRPDQCPDLTIQHIGRPNVSCPGGGGTCVTTVAVTIANIGAGDAGPFTVRTILDPNQSVIVDRFVANGLQSGDQLTLSVTTPPGGNCFDPDCTISATADSGGTVKECNEGNNTLTTGAPG